jgi:hypothetical protein
MWTRYARRATEGNLRAWSAKVGGRPITVWNYCGGAGGKWVYAPPQYPHRVCEYYRTFRTLLAGAFINGETLSTSPQKRGAENHAAKLTWHLAITLAAEFADQLNGCAC